MGKYRKNSQKSQSGSYQGNVFPNMANMAVNNPQHDKRTWRKRNHVPSIFIQDMDRSAGNLAYLPFTGNPAHGGSLPTPNNLQNHAFNFPNTLQTYPVCPLGPGPTFMGYQPQNEMNANVMPMPLLPPRPIESEQEHQDRLFLEQFRYAGQQQEYEPPRYDPTVHDTIRRMESLKVASEASANDNAGSPTSQLRGDAPEFVPGKKDDKVEGKSRNSGSQFSWTIVSSSSSGYQ